MKRSFAGLLVAISVSGCASWSREESAASLAARIQSVGREGKGNAEASDASRRLAALEPSAIVDLLRAMDAADPVACNWLRSSVDSIAERALERKEQLPAVQLEAFVLDRSHAGPVRRLAYEWLTKVDSTAPDRLIPRMLDDPSVEMRRDAVARQLDAAQKLLDSGDKAAALSVFKKLFPASRDLDQVDIITKRLESLEEKVDLTSHFGCVQAWKLIGPFDSTDRRGFGAAYPPETELKLDAEYAGKDAPVRWIEHTTTDTFGVVDLNKMLGKHMGVAAYAVAWVDSAAEQAVHIRAGSPNAVKIWLNGDLVLARDEYHHGDSMDQYQAAAHLRPGKNMILVKVCQNDQKEDWAQDWKFQVRVCDPTGGGVL